MKTQAIFEKEKKFIHQAYKRKKVIIDKGTGCYLEDIEGNKFLDMVGGLGSCSLGHSNPEVIDSLKKQSEKIFNVTNVFYTVPEILLAEKLSKISGLNKVFFSNTGTEANEAALKLAKKTTGKQKVISTINGFHGRTMGSLSVTWKEEYKSYCKPMVPGSYFIPYNDTEALKESIDKKTASFIVEPIQGEGGVNIPSPNYLKEVQEICDDYGCKLIVDEVSTGYGRTGKYFCYQHSKILPDITTLAKGLANGIPIGATITKEGIEFDNKEHGTTFGGNPLSASAALSTIGYLEKHKLIENAKEKGEYLITKLESIAQKSALIDNVRGKGLLLGVEFVNGCSDIVELSQKKGILLNTVTNKTIRLMPPISISKSECDFFLDNFKQILEGLE